MKKVKLRLDALAAESFETGVADGAAGTVRAHITATRCTTSPDRTCQGYLSCDFNSRDLVCTGGNCTDYGTCFEPTCPDRTQTCETECQDTCFSCNSCVLTCHETCTCG